MCMVGAQDPKSRSSGLSSYPTPPPTCCLEPKPQFPQLWDGASGLKHITVLPIGGEHPEKGLP